jgi:WhiB family redox-sensing transcriptional regulator
MTSTPWQSAAACRTADGRLFLEHDGERPPARQQREVTAKAVCARCPVMDACRAHAIAAAEPAGIWGGLTVEERRELSTPTPERLLVTSAERLGRQVQSARRERGVTSTQLAAALGIQRTYLSEIENGRRQPGPATAMRLRRFLGVDAVA